MTLPAAQMKGLRLARNGFQLEVDSLAAPAGQILCLLGPTGAGKSTLLSILAGLTPCDAGPPRVNGTPLAADSPIELRRTLSLVFQRPQMLAGSVRSNVEFGLRLRGQTGGDLVDRLLADLQLASMAHRRATELSGGETQLVALARALALQPKLLLLDEPTASLDPARVAIVERVVRRLASEAGTAVIWATHNLFQARRVADQVALLLEGRVVEAGPTAKIFEAPRDSRTADFLAGRYIC